MIKSLQNRWARADRGNVAVWFALASMAIAGLGAGALTLTRLHGSGARLQDLADGAALAAVVEAQTPSVSDAEIKDAARRFDGGARSRSTAEFDGAAMQVEIVRRAPPEVTVTLDQKVHTILSAFIGRDSIAIRKRATAVAGEERRTCLHVLDPNAAESLRLQGNPDLAAPDCMIQVNSTAQDGLFAWGSPSVQAEATYAAGPGASKVRNWFSAPSFDQPARPDPLAGRIAWPRPDTECIRPEPDDKVLEPGAYCEALTLNQDTRLQPGTYVVQRGGVEIRRRVTAEGVTLVLLDPQGAFVLRSPGQLKLTAPATGQWAGVALAAKAGAAMPTSTLHGSPEMEFEGAIYLPGHRFVLHGSPDAGGAGPNRSLIVRQFAMQGSPTLSLAGGHPSGVYKTARLTK